MKFDVYDKKIEIKDLVGKNYDYYKPIFEIFESGTEKKYFNKNAMLSAPYWLIYRKMVAHGAVIIGIQIILLMLAFTLKSPIFAVAFALSFLEYVRVGFYGNYSYYKKIKKLKEYGDNVEVKYRHKFVNDKSGVDLQITIAWIIGTIIITIIALY